MAFFKSNDKESTLTRKYKKNEKNTYIIKTMKTHSFKQIVKSSSKVISARLCSY